jgi:HAD superfamily hydrolase (TIGR01509 family)
MTALALLFDLDGTMVDTDALHLAAWNSILRRSGRSIDIDFYKTRVMGFDNEAVTAALFPNQPAHQRAALVEEKETAFRSFVDRLDPTPGLDDLLGWAEAKALPVAVVTNAPRANARLLLRGLGLEQRFPVLIIGEELARGKPDPLPYATALSELGATPAHAIAFEDSLSGVRAAAGAGIDTIGMLTALPETALRQAGAFMVANDFTDAALRATLAERLGRG